MGNNMSEDKIELDKETLKKLFSVANMELPEDIKSSDVEKLAGKLQHDLDGLKAGINLEKQPEINSTLAEAQANIVNEYLSGGQDQRRPRTVLIIDDLGVIVNVFPPYNLAAAPVL